MIKITGLWVNKDKNGDTYYSGSLGNAKIFIFKNKYKKEGSKEPVANLFIADKQQNAGTQQPNNSQQKNADISDVEKDFKRLTGAKK